MNKFFPLLFFYLIFNSETNAQQWQWAKSWEANSSVEISTFKSNENYLYAAGKCTTAFTLDTFQVDDQKER